MKICLWRYKDNIRNFPGYHLSADEEGCRVIRRLLSSIRKYQSITLQVPSLDVHKVPNNHGGNARVFAADNWQVRTKDSLPSEHFEFTEIGKTLRLESSRQQIECILAGVDDIEQGKGDYCIGGDGDQLLWFWWQVSPKIRSKKQLKR